MRFDPWMLRFDPSRKVTNEVLRGLPKLIMNKKAVVAPRFAYAMLVPCARAQVGSKNEVGLVIGATIRP